MKLSNYSQLAAVTIYNWNTSSEVTNSEIINMLERLGLQNDPLSEGVIFRHLLATYSANDADSPRIPLFVKEPLLERHWRDLKELDPELFAAAKAYYIYARAVNNFEGSDTRVIYSIPELRRLKLETLETGSPEATAIASMWLAMELTLANPIQAINEIEYSLPYLPLYTTDKNLQNILSDVIAHDWLRGAYSELFIPSRAFFHSKQIIEKESQNKNSMVRTWAYFSAIDALLIQNRYDDALALSDDAIEHISEVESVHEKLLTLVQRLRIIVFSKGDGYGESANLLIEQIRQLDTTKVKIKTQELTSYAEALYAAITHDKTSFDSYVKRYKEIVISTIPGSGFKEKIKLRLELELSRLYDANGDYQQSYAHTKAYNQLLVEKNTEQFKFSSSSFNDGIAKDIELARYRQKELSMLRDEKDGLSSDKEAMKTTIIALTVTIIIILAFWLWLTKRQGDLIIEKDSLTGALTRRAMINSLKNSLKNEKRSCVALLDIDNFKKINDKYGHITGDEVLTVFTQIIKNRIRKSDKLCRYGNEEFLICFSDSDRRSAERILNELNMALSGQKFWRAADEKFSVSFSYGLINVNGETNFDNIIKACNELLNKAKREGNAGAAPLPL
ncbi:GGDEF domain-containing protein [Alteromonas gracilis]|uniref:GGDEF domain-containing protein n=1 Tax=Alteromonas gracilis TaxID=1479524 RepID=UPI003736EFB0